LQRNRKIAVCSLIAFLLLLSVDFIRETAAESEDTPQTIEFLISVVSRSHLTFMRNGECHTSEEAAKHIRGKYDYFRPQIKTPEEFIALCASQSLLSGEPYLVVTPQGKVPLGKWLRQMLAQHRNGM
jgi:hypothetical protein